jgi:hypothetical protein
VIAHLRRLDELRRLRLRLVVPGVDPGSHEEVVIANGCVQRGDAAGASLHSLEPDHLDELLVVAGFLERPPPELRVVPLP